MKVTLVSLTQDMVPQGFKSPESLIVYTARVSNPANQDNPNNANLIKYLVQNKHWSPFEMVDMTVEIETSRAIAQQILRHRSFSFQEFSQRYATVDKLGEELFERVEARGKAQTNRQSSLDNLNRETKLWFEGTVRAHQEDSEARYKLALEKGVAPEVARFLLPLNTKTRLYMKGSVRSWIHYLQIRLDIHAQQEHREVAHRIAAIFAIHFPNIAEALDLG